MKKIILFSFGLLACTIFLDRVLAWSMDAIYPEIKSGESGGAINYFLALEENPDFLIMGNSRAHHHVIPDSFELNTFNLSHNGMALPFQAGLISILKSQQKMPKVLLLQIEPSFFLNRSDLDERDAQFLKYFYGKNELVTEYINRISTNEKIKYFFKLYRYNGKIFGLLLNYFKSKNRKEKLNYDGFEPLEYNPKDTIRLNNEIKKLEKIKHSKRVMTIDSIALSYVQDVLDMCEEADTKIIFFTAPYYWDQNSEQGKLNLQQYFDERDILYFNYNTIILPELKKKKFWMDGTHLNIKGTKILTSDLKKRLHSILDN